MPEAATTPDVSGSDSVRPSISLDDAMNRDVWEPEAATPEVEEDGQSDIGPDEAAYSDQETDEIDASGIVDDVNVEEGAGEGDEPSTPEPADDVTITIGKDKVAIGDLKKGYFREADYTRHKQIVSHRERELESLSARVSQSVHKIADFLSRQIPDEPNAQLAITDPGRFVREKAMHDQAMAQLSEIFSVGKDVGAVAEGLTADQHKALVDSEADKLAAVLPHLRKPGEQEKFFTAAFDTGKQLGYSEEEMQGATDHRLFMLAHYARIGMRTVKAKAAAMQKVKDVPPVAPARRPQGANPSRARANQDAMKRLARTGSLADAMAIDFD